MNRRPVANRQWPGLVRREQWARRGRWARLVIVAVTATASLGALPGCARALGQSATNSYLIIDALEAAAGAKPDTFGGTLASDVLTFVKKDVNGTQTLVPTIFSDNLQVTMRLAMKDPGTSDNATQPSTTNFITVTRYHVNYVRTDGRNTPGVDVPYAFDGAATFTVGADVVKASMTLVRVQAKEEAPLKSLVDSASTVSISTIAEITFYGKDQVGRDVSVTGRISVNFADWGDPS